MNQQQIIDLTNALANLNTNIGVIATSAQALQGAQAATAQAAQDAATSANQVAQAVQAMQQQQQQQAGAQAQAGAQQPMQVGNNAGNPQGVFNLPPVIAPNRERIEGFLQEQLLIRTRLSEQARTEIIQLNAISSTGRANNVQLPATAEYILNRAMSNLVGTALGGTRNGQYIANCMDADAMGIPRPPAPPAIPYRSHYYSRGGGSRGGHRGRGGRGGK
jgi:hypothetical protein